MLYTLRSGRTIEITFNQWYEMTDEDEEYLVAYGVGDFIENPFKSSSLENPNFNIEVDVPQLTDLSIEDRFNNIEEEE